MPSSSSTSNAGIATVKYELLKTLAALDRGVAAGDDDRDDVRRLVENLETFAKATTSMTMSGGVGGRRSLAPVDAQLEAALDGEWRLAYSSTFAGEQPGSQGFTGAPGGGGGGNLNLRGVYQRVSNEGKTCDNVVTFSGGGLPFGHGVLGARVRGDGRDTTITSTGVTVESSSLGLPPLGVAQPAGRASGGGSRGTDGR